MRTIEVLALMFDRRVNQSKIPERLVAGELTSTVTSVPVGVLAVTLGVKVIVAPETLRLARTSSPRARAAAMVPPVEVTVRAAS